jgi:hypothetical protein
MNKWPLFCTLLFTQSSLIAQFSAVSYTTASTTYHQNFDQLPLSGSFILTGKGPHALDTPPLSVAMLKGWQVFQVTGNQSNTSVLTGTGSGTGSGIYSYGLSGNNNRALGALASGTGAYAFGVVLENLTGSMLNKINIRYKATQWRKGGSGNTNTWKFSYQTRQTNNIDTGNLIKKTEGNLISIHSSSGSATLNGHLSTNQYNINITITDIIWRPGEKLILRWDDQDETGSDDGMAIDDFEFSATTEINAPTISQPIIDSIGTSITKISTVINDQLAHTQIRFEYDTVAVMSHPTVVTNLSPSSIVAGSGNTVVTFQLNGLSPGKKYYARGIAINSAGFTMSDTIEFTTITTIPDITTDSIIRVDSSEWNVYGKMISDNGAAISEIGFCWVINDTPLINHHRSPVSLKDSIVMIHLKDLPLNTKIFIRSYAINDKGVGYGNPLSFRTPVSVHSFTTLQTHSNEDTLTYELRLHQSVDSITISHFSLKTIPENGASIISVERKTDSSYTIKIESGNLDAVLQPILHRNVNQSPTIHPLFFEGDKIVIDKTSPEILRISIPNRSYKVKDTIPITIITKPDPSSLMLLEGSLSGYPIQNLRKENDSIYNAISVISTNDIEINASAEHLIFLQLKDSANNKTPISNFKIIQNNDAIDHTRPTIKSLILPERKKYKAGDTLHFILIANEKIQCDTIIGKPVLSVTIGTRIRNPVLSISTDTSLQFSYVIQADEFDADGIRLANTITLNNSIIQDPAGNLLLNSIPSAGIINDILVDAILPEIIGVITPIAKLYGLNDTLQFQIFFSEPILFDSKQSPFLETVIGNTTYKIPYSYIPSGNTLIFQLPITKGMLDKNGIGLSNQLFDATSITDDIGNPIVPLLKNIGALSSIDIDGIPPKWLDSTAMNIPICKKGQLLIDKFLQVYDEEKTGGLQWSIVEPPKHGYINGLPFNSKQTIDIHEPKNIVYHNTDNNSSKDSCLIEVSDGINCIRKQLIFQFFPEIKNNILFKDQIICSGTIPEVIKGSTPSGGNETYDYQWQMSTQIAGPLFQAIPLNIHSALQPGSLQQSTQFRRIVQSGGCTDTSQSILIEVKTKGLWLGKQNNSWHLGSNWCGAMVPDIQTDVILQANDQVVQINDSAFCKSLLLLDQSRLTLSGILTYENSIIAQQSIRSDNGTLIAAGKSKQYLPAQAFENNRLDHLVVKGTELSLSDSLFLNQSLQLVQGKFLTQDMLILDSQAIIAPNAAATQIIGRITKKFVLHNNWMTHPFKENIIASNINVQHSTPLPSHAFFTYSGNEKSEPYTCINHTYSNIQKSISWKILEQVNNDSAYLWKRSSGISLFKPFEKKVYANIELFGQPIVGDEEISLPAAQDTQYHFIGNPYIAKILSKNISRSQTVGHYFWVWDSSLAEMGGFIAKAFDGNHIIEPMQGLIIKNSHLTNAFIRFSEQAKITQLLPDSINGIIENRYQVALSLYKEQLLLDQFQLIDIDTSSIRFDEDDAEKLFNQDYNFYSLSYDQIPLGIDARNVTTQTYIPLGIQTKSPGSYTIRFNRVWLPSNLQLELHDLFTGNITKVKHDSLYQFHITADTTSFGEKRFVLRTPIPPVPQEEPIIMKLSPVPAQYQLNYYFKAYKAGHSFALIKNMDGQILRKQILGQQQEGNFQISLNGLLSGSYILEIHSGNKFAASTFIKL